MSTQVVVIADFTGELVAATHTFEVTDPSEFKTVVVDDFNDFDKIAVQRQNFGASGWTDYTDQGENVVMDIKNNSVTPLKPGVYGLTGTITAPVTIFTESI